MFYCIMSEHFKVIFLDEGSKRDSEKDDLPKLTKFMANEKTRMEIQVI